MVSKYNLNTFFKGTILSLLVYTGYLAVAATVQGKHYLENLDQKKKDKTEAKEMAVQVKSDMLPSVDETIADILKIKVPEHLKNPPKVEKQQ